MRNNYILTLVIFIIFGFSNISLAQSDNASDVAYNTGWNNGTNGGSGFGSWNISTPANSGVFIGSSDINVGGESWGMFANSGATSSATRDFNTPMTENDIFQIQMDNGNIQNGGTVGFGLQNSSGQNLMEFFFVGGGNNYSINDQGGSVETSVGFTNGGLSVSIELTSATQFTVTINTNGGSNEMIPGKTLIANANQSISRLRLFNANAGGGGASDAFFNSMSQTIILPVQLTSFISTTKNTNINLNWQTASELNNSHFEIQQSTNSRTWKTIGKVEGKGTTNEVQNYSYTDKSPSQGINYYRLKQVDYDGAFEYSFVVSAEMGKDQAISVFPNPVTDNVVFEFETEQKKGTLLSVYNMNGQVVRQVRLAENYSKMELDLSDLVEGIYVVEVTNGETHVVERFIKQ